MNLSIATCQFPISANICNNLKYITNQMSNAKNHGAEVVHFPEASLSGYAGTDFPSLDRYDWNLLVECTHQILELARRYRLWVVLGSTHRLSGDHKPHNSLYIINDEGRIIDRYDKMFCAGDADGKTVDLAHYSSGSHFCVFTIKGIRCGALICHDYRYPELYREYKKRGVQLMFHSYHAGNIPTERFHAMKSVVGDKLQPFNSGSTIPGITMPAAMHVAAANNYMWISCPNSSKRESCWPSFFVRPDGIITGRLRNNTAGVLISTVDTEEEYYDSTVAWRDRAMNGEYHSGVLVQDKRSENRTEL